MAMLHIEKPDQSVDVNTELVEHQKQCLNQVSNAPQNAARIIIPCSHGLNHDTPYCREIIISQIFRVCNAAKMQKPTMDSVCPGSMEILTGNRIRFFVFTRDERKQYLFF